MASIEFLDKARNDLTNHYNSVVKSWKKLNGPTARDDLDRNCYNEEKHLDDKPVDKIMQYNGNSGKKGKT